MRIISADFNAGTETGAICLECQGSQDDMRDQGIGVGDWMWLSDGELVLGAKLAIDDRYGMVGIPRWNTLVHLDDDDTREVAAVQDQLIPLLSRRDGDPEVETRIFQLLTILEVIAPESVEDRSSGYSVKRRAGALYLLGEYELALLVLKEAPEARLDDPDLGAFYLETLRKVDLDRADAEATLQAVAEGAGAPLLAACINVRSAVADRVSDEDFTGLGRQILDWVARFERAPGRDRVRASLLAQVRFNEGLTLLRLGRSSEAHEAFGRAHAANPIESAIDEALRLEAYGDEARQIASRMRGESPLVAA